MKPTTPITTLRKQRITGEREAGFSSEPLEVNVIFTDSETTAAALKTAESLARDLGACIRLRAGIAVPMALPLDQPPVSVQFTEGLLSGLASQLKQDEFQPAVHLYICRNWPETLLGVLKPNSLVVVGGRKRWWPTAVSRISRILRAKGHRVVLADPRGTQRYVCSEDRSAGSPETDRHAGETARLFFEDPGMSVR